MKDVSELIALVDKKFGEGTLMQYGKTEPQKVETISTSMPSIDAALGIGGIPIGRIIEVYGPESSGKTTLALHIIAEAQKLGKGVAFIDAEHALDPIYAKTIGVDIENLLISQPDSGEQALEITETAIRSGLVSLVVIDSVAALTPRAEIDGEMGDSLPGLQARLMSQATRKLVAIAAKMNCTILFINQLRDKIGVMWGSPETTTGGKALRFYTSIRIDIRRIGALKEGEKVIGNRTKAKVVKNKLALPFKEVEFDIIYGEGMSKESDLLELAVSRGVITKKGSYHYYGDKSFAQGKEAARKYLKENPEFFSQIQEEIKKGS